MGKKCFVLHNEIIDVFYDRIYIPIVENCPFVLMMLGLLDQWNMERIEIFFS